MTRQAPDRGRRVVIGVGNEYRRDDGFGPAVAARLAQLRETDHRLSTVDVMASDGEPTRLIDLWTGAELAVVVDAVHDGCDHGGHRYELVLDDREDELAGLAGDRSASSHGISLGSTVELGRALGRLPRRLVVVAVGGTEFGFGTGLTPEVAAEVEPVVERVRDLVG